MRATTLLVSALALTAVLLGGCGGTGQCGADADVTGNIGSGSYGLTDAEGTRRFPHEGRDVQVEVDRDAGVVRATWLNDSKQLVVETWRIVR